MCGIAGFFDFTGLRTRVGSAKKNNNCFQSALESLSKRGPDTGGVWQDHLIWLGHRRLSILDLSHLGTQPMSFKNYVITFNGMIYNYRDIRQALIQKGYSFHTETDTEVLLAGWAEWQQDLLPRLQGMLALAHWDKAVKSLR